MESNTTNQETIQRGKIERNTMKEMAKHIQLLAPLVATVTYAAALSPPGGVWQDTAGGLPGDPIIRSTQYVRYQIFFYCNTTAFASSLMVVVLSLLLFFVNRNVDSSREDAPPRLSARGWRQGNLSIIVTPLVLLMLLGLLSLTGAYAAGTFQNTFTAVFTSLLVAAVFAYAAVHWRVLAPLQDKYNNGLAEFPNGKQNREVLMQLAAFALTVTYAGGLSTPGGFWDSTEGGSHPGDPILKGGLLNAFFVCNTTAFVASLLVINVVLLLPKIWCTKAAGIGGCIVMLFCLLSSYAVGSSRQTDTAIKLASQIGVSLVYIVLQALVINRFYKNRALVSALYKETTQTSDPRAERLEKAYSEYIQLLATLALTITFQAGFHPPGGLWQDNSDGHKAGDPILQLMNTRRYTAFFYCNSIAFAASLAIMMLVQIRPLLKHRVLEQAMVLDLLALVGAYAIGSCRQETATVYAMGIGGAALVYVVLHVVMLDPKENHGRLTTQVDDRYDHYLSLDVMGYGLFLFAILVATTTYQAGFTPPGGFVVSNDGSGHHAGDPVLLHNYPGRYRVFFYCNSTSFMVSIAIIILLVNPNIYRPAIRTHALSVCTFVSFVCLLAAFACGTTQHVKTSIHTLVLLAVVFCFAALLFLVFFLRSLLFPVSSSSAAPMTVACADAHAPQEPTDDEGRTRPASRKAKQSWKYQMTVGILVASVTYQGGLDPPGGSWPRSSDGHHAGHPVMRDNMRRRYLIFSYSNSTSFLATIFLMLLSLLMPSPESWMSRTTSPIVMLGCFGLLGAYAAGSNSEWKTSMHVVAIVFSVLAYFGIHVVISLLQQKGGGQAQAPENIGSGPDEIAPAPRNDDM